MTEDILRIEAISHRYQEKTSLSNCSMQLAKGQIACILGASGSGKSTLLRCIAGFEELTSGSIYLQGKCVASRTMHKPPEERRCGFLFQDYALFPHLTVAENVGFGLRSWPKELRLKKIDELLAAVSLQSFRQRYPHELSGGQQQRVALARALAPEPDLLLLDEPFSNLDTALREKLKYELKSLLQNFGVTALIVTHNQDEAFDLADQIGVMMEGKMEQWGNPYQLYHFPATKAVATFLGMSAFIDAEVSEEGCLYSELGELSCQDNLKGLAGQKVSVLLRPDDLVHDDESPLKAEVVKVVFRGMFWIYHLRLSSGTELLCFTSSHHENHAPGSSIGIRLDLQHAVILR